MSSDLRNKHLFLTAHHSFENYVEKYHYYSLYLCEDGRCSKTELDSLIWELVSSVKSGSLLRSDILLPFYQLRTGVHFQSRRYFHLDVHFFRPFSVNSMDGCVGKSQ